MRGWTTSDGKKLKKILKKFKKKNVSVRDLLQHTYTYIHTYIYIYIYIHIHIHIHIYIYI